MKRTRAALTMLLVSAFALAARDLCWPIGQTELESNPNVSPADSDQDRAS